MSTTEPQPNARKANRRWFQYSLRRRLVCVTVCVVLCSWLALKMWRAERHRKAAAAMGEWGEDLASSGKKRVGRAAEILNVFETLFRHQFGHNESAAQASAWAYFLEIEKKDPPTDFLKRFATNRPPVKRGSEFEDGEGVKSYISSYKWVTDDEVELTGGYYEGNMSASGHTYTVRRTDGKWVVEKDEPRWIASIARPASIGCPAVARMVITAHPSPEWPPRNARKAIVRA